MVSSSPVSSSPVPSHPLAGFFEARSVAVIGASSDPDKLGGRPIRYFRDAGYTGAIYPVNSRSAEIQGYPAYRSVFDIPGPVDQAMLMLPAAACLAALEACGRKGIRFVQVLSSGFGEAGPDGLAAQQALLDCARRHGIRILGPNCLGLVSVRERFYATFSTALDGLVPVAGGIAVATQSGAFGSCAYSMAIQRGLGLSRIVATGNEADVDVAECIDYLAEDPETRVICAAIEGAGDGNRLRRALHKAADRGKPVAIMKVGTTAIGIAAAATHTGALAGDDAAFDTVFRECGAWRARSIEEMLDVAEYCLVSPPPANERAVVVTVSGGLGILMADAAEGVGLALPPIDEAVAGRLNALLPFAPVGNPYDTTAQVGAVKGGLAGVTDILLDGTDAATVLLYIAQMPAAPVRFEPTRVALTELRGRYPDRCLVLVGPSDPGVRDRVVADGLMMFTDASRAMVAAGAAAAIAARRRRMHARAADGDGRRDGLRHGRRAGTIVSLRARADIGSEVGAKAVLADAGLPMLPETLCTSRDQAVAAATSMGLPVVAKIVSPDIAHKTEIGGVLLGLADPQAVAAAFDTLMDRARRAAPSARLHGVLIAPMAGKGVETILGVHRDPVFGPMVMFGLGGVAVELYKDVAFASPPLDTDGARALICRVKAARMLSGWRGNPPLDTEALAATLVALSRFAVDHADELDGVDLNPVLVRERGVVCLDALITLRPDKAH